MTDDDLERLKSQRQWYESELLRFPGNEWIKDIRDELAKRIRDEEARRRREADQGRLF